MFCTKCGTKNEEEVNFCKQCGNRIGQQTTDPVNEENGAPETGIERTEFTRPVNNQAVVQNQTVQNQTVIQPVNRMEPVPSDKKKKNGFIGMGAVAIAVIAVIVVIFVVVKPALNNNVLKDILSAAQATVEAGSFEMKAVAINKLYDDEEVLEGVFEIDLKKEKMAYDYTIDGDREILWEDMSYSADEDGIYYNKNVSSKVEAIFEYYESITENINNLSKYDWDNLFDELGVSRYVDKKKFTKCIQELEENLNNPDYYENFCDDFTIKNTSKGKIYHMDVKVNKFIKSVIDTMSPAFEDLDYWGMDFDDVADSILEEIDFIKELVIEITIKGGKLVAFDVDATVEGWNENIQYIYNFDINDIGKASLNKKSIEKLIDEYNNY